MCTIDTVSISIICTQSVLFSPFEDAGGPDDPEWKLKLCYAKSDC